MAAIEITPPKRWRSEADPDYSSTDIDEVEAHDAVVSQNAWIELRLRESGRFKTDKMLNGELARNKALLFEWELRKRQAGVTGNSDWDKDIDADTKVGEANSLAASAAP